MKKILIILFILICFFKISLACHKKGPMCFASKNPAMMTVDVSLSPTFAFASSSGTSGCKNWDYSLNLFDNFINDNFDKIKEESSRGDGKYLSAMYSLMGCNKKYYNNFKVVIKKNYIKLFNFFENNKNVIIYNFKDKVDILINGDNNFQCLS